MRVSAAISYDHAPAAVFAMITDPAFQERKLAGTGALSWEVDVVEVGDGTEIRTLRRLPSDRVPEPFRSLVGPDLTVRQVDTWGPADATGARSGQLVVEVDRAPLRLDGGLRLMPVEGRTRQTVDGELKARIPVVGGRVERGMEPAILAAIEAEERLGREWLTGA